MKSFEATLPDGSPGMLYQFILLAPTDLKVPMNERGRYDDKGTPTVIDKFSVGQMAGLEMAIDAIKTATAGKFVSFQYKDRVTISCVGNQKAENEDFSDMPTFEITVERD